MSSFFTTPASQRKRKRPDTSAGAATAKRRNTAASTARPHNDTRARKERDDSISGSEDTEDEEPRRAPDVEEEEATSESEAENETAAERRLRLAERYLSNIREEVDEAGFDAADVDRDLIAERLKEDVAESKGKLYRHIASELSFATATHTFARADQNVVTAVAACAPYVYTVAKDMSIVKWETMDPVTLSASPPDITNGTAENGAQRNSNITPRRKPKKLAYTRGHRARHGDASYTHHTRPILCVAASASGKFLATGGADARLIIWDVSSPSTLVPLKVFTQHRDAVTGLAFRRGTNQLFSASADRTIKIWSLDELAYVETLFGHQDSVVDVAALGEEKCVSVGARDRTARLWKVVEESQLVFRGGGGEGARKRARGTGRPGKAKAGKNTDRLALIDAETFVTGSDNGGLSLWSIHKKKPVFTLPLAHGLDPPLRPDEASAEMEPQERHVAAGPQPRWITALAALPFSDVVVSGSWDGVVRVWRVSADRRRIEAVGAVGVADGELGEGMEGVVKGLESAGVDGEMEDGAADSNAPEEKVAKGVINDLAVFERGERGADGLCVVAAVGKEHRLGNWRKWKGKNGGVVFEVKRKEAQVNGQDGHVDGNDDA
ncbi:pre-rRNA processing protein [Coniosporium tulheliwenetii]|uniref:Pre-rRNA processing protein n=1 Tax=Coniosporium tulheliwenetii TaxID=3383036 RepID=A0ACC2ZBJ1_9PEZI|nr:pre-rRNA processing protein [Cladosporium sp. JES 115]